MARERTDTERLDWLQEFGSHAGVGLIEDDNGHWALSGTGSQNVPEGDGPQDIWTSFLVQSGEWRGSVREAIDAIMDEEEAAGAPLEPSK